MRTYLERAKWLDMQIKYCLDNKPTGKHYDNYIKDLAALKIEIESNGCSQVICDCHNEIAESDVQEPDNHVQWFCKVTGEYCETAACTGKILCNNCQKALEICRRKHES